MPMPAFDMEPGSTSPPDGNLVPPSRDDAAAPPASAEAAAAKPLSSGTAPTKPPAASLTSITGRIKPASSAKAGDLTRLFALARREAPSAPVEPLAADEPAQIAAALAILDTPPEPTPMPMPVEAPMAEVAPELDTTPELPRVELAGFVEPSMVSEPAVDRPAEAAPAAEPPTPWPIVADTAEPLPVVLAPTDDGSASPEISEPAPDVVEPPAIPAPTLQIEPAAPPVPEPSRAPEWAPVPAPPTVPKFVDLADYWRSRRSGDHHPAAESIDHDFVTERWPGSLLIAYTPASQDPRGEPRPGRVTRLGTACKETQNAVDAGSHSTEWMLEVARTALINDEPVEELQRLATLTGDASFRMVALPLGPPKGLANAVLCTLLPSPGAPRFGKRRIWL